MGADAADNVGVGSVGIQRGGIGVDGDVQLGLIGNSLGSRSVGSLGSHSQLGELLAPCGKAALQGVDLAHVVADGGQGVGSSLGVALAGVADQNDLLVQTLGGLLHGSLTGLQIAVLGGIHVIGQSAGDGGGAGVGSLPDIEEDIAGIFQQALGILGGDILHGSIGSRCLGGCLGSGTAAGSQTQHHCQNQQCREKSLHGDLPTF